MMVRAADVKGIWLEDWKSGDEIKEENCCKEVMGVALVHTDIVY